MAVVTHLATDLSCSCLYLQ